MEIRDLRAVLDDIAAELEALHDTIKTGLENQPRLSSSHNYGNTPDSDLGEPKSDGKHTTRT